MSQSLSPRGQLTVRTIAMPADTNANGDIFGGWILSQMDLACVRAAQVYAENYAVTVGLESRNFHKPVLVGDEVSFYTQVLRTGRTSVTMKVETWARHDYGRAPVEEKVTEGVFSYVSVNKDKKGVPLLSRSSRAGGR